MINHVQFWEIVEALKAMTDIKDQWTIKSYVSKMRVHLDKCIFLLNAAIEGCLQKNAGSEDECFSRKAISILDEMKQLQTQLDPSELKLENSISIIGSLCEELHSRRSTLKPFLQQLFLHQDANLISDESGSGGQRDVEDSSSKGEESASEATVNSRPQGNSKSKKNKRNRSHKHK